MAQEGQLTADSDAKKSQVSSQKVKLLEYDSDFSQRTLIKPDFQVTLVSRDGVKFRTNANTLRMASPVFDTMLSLPQPEGDKEATIDSLDEDATVIKGILQIISGKEYPDIRLNFGLLQALALAAEKWDMQGLLSLFRMFFLNPGLVRDHAIGVYWAGCRFQWPDVVQIAASHSCQQDLFRERSQPLLRMLSSDSLLQLMIFHRKRHDSILSWFERRGEITYATGADKQTWNQLPMYNHFKYGFLEQMEQMAPVTTPSHSEIAQLVSKTCLVSPGNKLLEIRGRQPPDVQGLISELLTYWVQLPIFI